MSRLLNMNVLFRFANQRDTKRVPIIASGSCKPACWEGLIMMSPIAEYAYAVQVCERVRNQGAGHDC